MSVCVFVKKACMSELTFCRARSCLRATTKVAWLERKLTILKKICSRFHKTGYSYWGYMHIPLCSVYSSLL